MTLTAAAHAKVNIHLEVLHQRDDGYHEIESILQTVELHDRLQFRPTKGAIHVRCDHPSVPEDRTNLCHRAARMLREVVGTSAGVEIQIEKNIPVAAGLGGGSADAAATLLALPKLWRKSVEGERLYELATRLGADVPFFLRGGTQLARGVGDVLTPVTSSGSGHFLIVTPDQELSTAWVYQQLRMGLTHHRPKVNLQNYKALLMRFPDKTWPSINRLSDVVFPTFPKLHRLFLHLQDTGPQFAMLSGSGPSLFAVYSTLEEAKCAEESISGKDAFTWTGRSTTIGVVLSDAR